MNRVGRFVPPNKQILRDISLGFYYGAKIGVLGLNGAGKSTLLRIMAGIDKDYEGEAHAMPGIRIGYLAQEPQLEPGHSVREAVEEGVGDVFEAKKRLDEVYAAYAEPDADFDKLAAEQERLEKLLASADSSTLETQLEVAADALRLPPWDARVEHLSGGEKRRVALCRLLLEEPDLLLLDEPTNHLDAETVAWLETHLEKFPGAVLIVTHDRYFLDNVAGWILELDRGAGIPWEGNYSSWLDQKRQRLAQEEKTESARQRTLERELEWVRMAPRARQAKGKARLAAYEKLLAEEGMQKIEQVEIYLPPGPRLGNVVIEADRLRKGYGENLLMEDLSFKLPPAGIVGVIGPNGAGKTTLFNVISGFVKPTNGSLSWDGRPFHPKADKLVTHGITRTLQGVGLFGHLTALQNVMVGAATSKKAGFTSALLGLPRSDRDEARLRGEARDLLAQLGIAGIEHQAASSLAYPIQKRVALARALISKPRLLMLDEPSLGLAPLVVKQIFDAIREINRAQNTTVFLVEQNAHHALRLAHRAYVMQTGRIALSKRELERVKTLAGKTRVNGGSLLDDPRGILLTPGRKLFITNGPIADVMLVYAKSAPEQGARGISAFVVEKGFPGFSVAQKLIKMGCRGSPTGELVFDDCRVPAANRIGAENAGIAVLRSGLDLERAVAAAISVGAAERLLELSLAYARERKQFGKPIAEFQMIQAKLADMYVGVETMKGLAYKALAAENELEAGAGGRGEVHKLCAAALLHAAEACSKIAADAVQIHGGAGYMWEMEVNRIYRATKLIEIGAGTSEVRRMIIAEELLRA